MSCTFQFNILAWYFNSRYLVWMWLKSFVYAYAINVIPTLCKCLQISANERWKNSSHQSEFSQNEFIELSSLQNICISICATNNNYIAHLFTSQNQYNATAATSCSYEMKSINESDIIYGCYCHWCDVMWCDAKWLQFEMATFALCTSRNTYAWSMNVCEANGDIVVYLEIGDFATKHGAYLHVLQYILTWNFDKNKLRLTLQ